MNSRGLLSWGLAAIFVFYLFLLQASTSVMVPELMRTFHIDAGRVGLLSASYFYTYIFLQMPAGRFVDRYGARLMLSLSMLGCALACWLFATAHSLFVAEFSRILMGVFTATGVVGALYLASNWFAPERFATLVGLTEMLGMLGGALGQMLLAFSVSDYGWRSTILICAAIGLLGALLTAVIVRDHPNYELHYHARLQTANTSILFEFWQILKLPQAWLNGIFAGLVFAVITGFAALWSVPYLMKLYSISLTTAASTSAMVFWGAALGGPFTGWLADYLGKPRLLMFAGTALSLLTCLLIFYLPGLPLIAMFILLFLLGFFCSAYVLPFALVANIVPSTLRCTAMGFTNMMCILLGAPLVQPLIGWLLQHMHNYLLVDISSFTVQNYQWAFSILPLGLLLALFSAIFISDKVCAVSTTETNQS